MGMKYKDPTTGNFKEINVKVADTLPVGAEIDIDDNTPVPDGWVEVQKKGYANYNGYATTDQTTQAAYVTDMELTITTTGGDILIMSSFIANTVNGGTASVRVEIDGVVKGRISIVANDAERRYSESKIFTNISAGTHTIKISASRDGSGSNQVKFPKYYGRSLTAIEL